MSLLELKDVSMAYNGKVMALQHITMSVEKGEWVAIMGPSGSGKTTLMNIIGCMDHATGGSVVLDGIDLRNSTDAELTEMRRSKIGMVFQQPNPFPMTIYENVVYGLRINGVKDKAVLDEAVERSLIGASIWDEVKDRLHDSAIGLSGGQQQRVCVARVLATSPKIILLDEPTSALDPISAGKIEETLYSLKDKYTMLLVTRSMQQASRISEKTGFFLGGDLIEFNETKKMFLNPAHKETEDYITGKFG